MYTEQEWELDQKRRRADEWSHLHQTSLEWEQEEERYYEYKRWETEYYQSEEEIEEKFDQFGFVFMGDPPHMNRGFLGNLKVLSAQGRAKGFIITSYSTQASGFHLEKYKKQPNIWMSFLWRKACQ